MFLVVPSVWGPLEQEVGRRLSARAEGGSGGAPVFRAAVLTATALGAPLALVLVVAAPWWATLLFSGHVGVVVALAVAVAAFAANHVLRAAMAGAGAFRAYGACISLDSGSRLVACLGLAAAEVRSPVPYAFAVALAPLVPVTVLRRRGPAVEPGPMEPIGPLVANVVPLVGAQGLAQTLVNGGPIAVAVLAAPGEEAAAGQFLAALLIARIPLFFFQAVQGSLLPGLARFHAAGDRPGFVRQVRVLLIAVGAIACLGVAAAATLGPAVVAAAFGDAYGLGGRDLAILAAGTGCFMAATAGAQAAVALSAHRSVVVGWAVGVIAAGGSLAAGNALMFRVEMAFLVGTAAAASVHLVSLGGTVRKWPVLVDEGGRRG